MIVDLTDVGTWTVNSSKLILAGWYVFIDRSLVRLAPCHAHLAGCGGHCAVPHQDVRREEKSILWEYEHGSGDIIVDGKPDAGEPSRVVTRDQQVDLW